MQFLEEKKFDEHTMYTDIKIVIFVIACGLGYFSHFVCKFPKDFMLVAACVGVYAFLMTIHYYIETYLERDAFFISKTHEVSKLFTAPSASTHLKITSVDTMKLVEPIQELSENEFCLASEP